MRSRSSARSRNMRADSPVTVGIIFIGVAIFVSLLVANLLLFLQTANFFVSFFTEVMLICSKVVSLHLRTRAMPILRKGTEWSSATV